MNNFLSFITSLNEAYNRKMDQAGEECGLTRAEINVLVFLANNPELNNAKDIVKYRSMAKSHVNQALDSLQNKGYVKVEASVSDHRFKKIVLLEKSQEAVHGGRKAQKGFLSGLKKIFTLRKRRNGKDLTIRYIRRL